MNKTTRFLKREDGVTSIEYALLGVLIFLVIIGAVGLLGGRLAELYDYIAGQLTGAIGG